MNDADHSSHAFVPLDVSCKRQLAFPVACPSFVYRADYVKNVRLLAPFVDEIQLLFFESRLPELLPGPTIIRELEKIAQSDAVTYNVHLPLDLYPGHQDRAEREHAAETIDRIIQACAPLGPSTFTLHLNQNPKSSPAISPSQWQELQMETLARLINGGICSRSLSVENTDDPLEKAAPIIRALDLSVCMDMGHLMVYGANVDSFYRRWKARITLLHLHGVCGKRDHLPLNRLDPWRMRKAMAIAQLCKKPLTVEVYSRDALAASLKHILQWAADIPDRQPEPPGS